MVEPSYVYAHDSYNAVIGGVLVKPGTFRTIQTDTFIFHEMVRNGIWAVVSVKRSTDRSRLRTLTSPCLTS